MAHLYDTPDSEGYDVDGVRDGIFWAEAWHPPILSWVPSGRAWKRILCGVLHQPDARGERIFTSGGPYSRVLFHCHRREGEDIRAPDEHIIVAFEIDKIVLQPFIQRWRPLHDERVIAVRQKPNLPLVFY